MEVRTSWKMYPLKNIRMHVEIAPWKAVMLKVKLEFIMPDNLMVNMSKREKQWQI